MCFFLSGVLKMESMLIIIIEMFSKCVGATSQNNENRERRHNVFSEFDLIPWTWKSSKSLIQILKWMILFNHRNVNSITISLRCFTFLIIILLIYFNPLDWARLKSVHILHHNTYDWIVKCAIFVSNRWKTPTEKEKKRWHIPFVPFSHIYHKLSQLLDSKYCKNIDCNSS